MKSNVKTSDLFTCENPAILPLLKSCVYPWEILPLLKDYVLELIQREKEHLLEISPGVYAFGPVKVAPNAVLEGPTVLGKNCEIRSGAYLRGRILTGDGCVIGNSTELKNCLLLDGVQVPHFNYVGDSVFGARAHLGAAAVCSNLKNDKTNVVIHSEPEMLTGLQKVGSFLGDGVDVGCGCILNPGTVVGKYSAVYPLTSLRGVYPENCIVKGQNEIVQRIEKKK